LILRYFNPNFEKNAVPLPAHARYQMWHGESIQHEAEECGYDGAGGNDPKGRQEREGLGSEAFAGGGDERRDGVPCGEPARKALGAGGIDDGREEHPKLRDDRNTSPNVAIKTSKRGQCQTDGDGMKSCSNQCWASGKD
jgi:hypothetical protein